MNLGNHTTQIILAIIAAIAALGITIKIITKKKSNSDNTSIKVNKSDTGDIAGRDINKKF